MGEAGESRHRRLENSVEGRVFGQFVEPTGETVRPHSEMGELTLDVESASQQRQVFLVREVTTRHPSTNGGKQAIREQPDEEFQQVMPLGVQGSQLAFGYPEVPRHGEHADERRAHFAVLSVDLGQDFDSPAGN